MGWFGKKKFSEPARKAALARACKIITMQIQVSSGASEVYEKLHTYFALGYCFGVLQASIESLTQDNLSETEYATHISEGLGVVFESPEHGQRQYAVSRKYLEVEEFKAGQVEGATEYINILNGKSERPYELAMFLHNSTIK